MSIDEYINSLLKWIKNEVKIAKCKGVVVGISGGIDSALVSLLAKKAFPTNHLGLWIDINNSNESKNHAKQHAKQFKINLHSLNLTKANSLLAINSKQNSSKKNITQANINLKSRIRMMILYQYAQLNNYLVLGTSNKSEIYIGYFTKWGDSCADLYPLANLTKNQIQKLAKYLDIDEKILSKPPSADLYDGQEDEKEIGIKYSDLELFFKKEKLSPQIIEKITKLHQKNKHKQNIIFNSFSGVLDDN